jgi:hypothetical protein
MLKFWLERKKPYLTDVFFLFMFVKSTTRLEKEIKNMVSMQVVICQVGKLTGTNIQWNKTGRSRFSALVLVQWVKVNIPSFCYMLLLLFEILQANKYMTFSLLGFKFRSWPHVGLDQITKIILNLEKYRLLGKGRCSRKYMRDLMNFCPYSIAYYKTYSF